MKRHNSTSCILLLAIGLSTIFNQSFAQSQNIHKFLKEKQIWDEKLVVIYAPVELQNEVKDQLNIFQNSLTLLKKEKIVVVQIPYQLSVSNRMYLQQKLHYQKDRLNIWVIDEKGNLRMTSTKLTTVDQFLRVLDIETRPEAVARVQYLWNE